MSWLVEDPTTLIVAGALIEGLLAVALVKSGRGILILAMIGVFAVLGIGLLVERLVVTDREQLEPTLNGITAALEANDVEGVLSYVDPAAGGMRARVRSALAGVRITEARVKDLVVEINHDARPPTAQADFTGRVKGTYGGESSGGEGMLLRKLTVDFRRVGDRWLMTAYLDRGGIGGRRGD